MIGVIFDLDQTIIDSSIAYECRRNRNWQQVYALIPKMKPYEKVVELIKVLISNRIEVAVVTSSPRSYCEKILNYLGISNVITVCYHDTDKHKPDPEPYLKAISKMKTRENKLVYVVGDEENDIIAAKAIRVEGIRIISILTYWNNWKKYYFNTVQPDIYCRDEEYLTKLFYNFVMNTQGIGFRKRDLCVYQLFDYYPMRKTHDLLSEAIFNEVKWNNKEVKICKMFCNEFEKLKSMVPPDTYGIFVVPSSTVGTWNSKLTDYVVPRLVKSMRLIDCSKHIVRHTTHEKQAFGGDRSLASNLSTMRLQDKLPPQVLGAFIIDDITTSGNVFGACRQILINANIACDKIYCIAIGGTCRF